MRPFTSLLKLRVQKAYLRGLKPQCLLICLIPGINPRPTARVRKASPWGPAPLPANALSGLFAGVQGRDAPGAATATHSLTDSCGLFRRHRFAALLHSPTPSAAAVRAGN